MQNQTHESLKRDIRAAMQLKTTEELVRIWLIQNHSAWTDDAFDAVRSILLERTHELPEQGQPVTPVVEEPDQPFGAFRALNNLLYTLAAMVLITVVFSGRLFTLEGLGLLAAVIVAFVLYQRNKQQTTPPGK